MKNLFLFLFLFNSFFIFCDIKAITNDGKEVILKDDGTWQYVKNIKMELSLIDFNFMLREKDYNKDRYSNDVVIEFLLKNETDKIIKGYKILIEVKNSFGDLLNILEMISGDSILNVNESKADCFLFEDNQFIDDEVYDNFTVYNKENLILTLTKCQVIYK